MKRTKLNLQFQILGLELGQRLLSSLDSRMQPLATQTIKIPVGLALDCIFASN